MPPVPIRPGVYRLYAHIFGPPALATAREHPIEHGVPVATDRPLDPPFQQEWAILPIQDTPGAPYQIFLDTHPQVGLLAADDKLFANSVRPEDRTQWTFEPVIGGLQILSDKGLAWRADYLGAQIQLIAQKPEPQATWSLEFLRPIAAE
ncbi:hypothetical protein [Streptomyces sp. CBMA152]|uniref:hypothetical protein n=1 Tax=Streptomyces sp. CBMA152 TaxID=1896312 RepID=UPI00166065EB|nr:hypothetical protein [Streptomyces sp. CBMA152]MBD0741273.1 hypothetical protein [Streptomyces sp. CBMA152]